jgi:KDO2-lipid IV(A) lauroyltransferase
VKYLQLRVAEFLSRLLPRQVGYGLARRIADVYVLADRRGREAVMANLNRIYQHRGVTLSRCALRVLARENFLNFAKYVLDFFHFLNVPPERARQFIDDNHLPQKIDELLAHGQGLIFLSAHLGNWELGGAAMAQRGYKMNAVALWQPNPKLNELYQSYRIRRQIKPIPFGRAGRECLLALHRNECVAVLGDRDFSGARHTVEFFGKPARLPVGPAKLALATGAPILPAFMVRLPDETYKYVVEEPLWADKTRDSVDAVMRRIAQAMECVSSQYSEQWYLFHDLWDIEGDRVAATTAAFGVPPADAGDVTEDE